MSADRRAPLKGELKVDSAVTSLGATRSLAPTTNLDALTEEFD